MTDTRIWKHLRRSTATVKHLFDTEESSSPLCRKTSTLHNSRRWAQVQERIDSLPACKTCLARENLNNTSARQITQPVPTEKKPFDEKDYVWKYMDGLFATVIHAFGKEATIPFCGRTPEEYGIYWHSDPEKVAGKSKCKNCVKYAH